MASPSFAQSREGDARSAQQRGDAPREGGPQQTILPYEPITQIRARSVKFFRPAETPVRPEETPEGCPPVGGAYGSYNWGQLTQKEIKSLLSNYSQWTTSFKIDANGNAQSTFPAARGRVDKGSYRITIDFLRYMTQTVYANEEEKQILGRCVVGVGLRTVCDIETFSTSAEFSLLGFTAKASVNQAAGNIRFDSIGIFNEEVASLMPTNVSLDESGIVQAAAATAAIRGLMNMKETILVPHVIAVQPEKSVRNQDENRTNLLARVSQG